MSSILRYLLPTAIRSVRGSWWLVDLHVDLRGVPQCPVVAHLLLHHVVLICLVLVVGSCTQDVSPGSDETGGSGRSLRLLCGQVGLQILVVAAVLNSLSDLLSALVDDHKRLIHRPPLETGRHFNGLLLLLVRGEALLVALIVGLDYVLVGLPLVVIGLVLRRPLLISHAFLDEAIREGENPWLVGSHGSHHLRLDCILSIVRLSHHHLVVLLPPLLHLLRHVLKGLVCGWHSIRRPLHLIQHAVPSVAHLVVTGPLCSLGYGRRAFDRFSMRIGRLGRVHLAHSVDLLGHELRLRLMLHHGQLLHIHAAHTLVHHLLVPDDILVL